MGFGVAGDVGVSLKTQELYALVFLARYLDLFTDFVSLYNTVMKLVFILSSLAIVWCMRSHPLVRRSYDRDLDTFRHYLLVLGSFVLALFVHEVFTFQEVLQCALVAEHPMFLCKVFLVIPLRAFRGCYCQKYRDAFA